MMLDQGKSGLTLLWAGSGAVPQFCGLGSGSGAVTVGRTGLVAEVFSNPRTSFTSRDISTQKQMSFVFDYSSVKMSGLDLKEFLVAPGSVVGTTDAYSLEGFTTLTFDGTNELQLEVVYETF